MSSIVVKIGGSFLTAKSESHRFPLNIEEIRSQAREFLNLGRLKGISRDIRHILESHRILLVHGAGPFGHAMVEGLKSGYDIDPMHIHASMLVLNEFVIRALTDIGVLCERVSPMDSVLHRGKFHTDRLVKEMVSKERSGILPVSHGDIVPSKNGEIDGHQVISGDLVVRDLSLSWPADRLIMVTDMNGILDTDPRKGEGRTIPRITLDKCTDLLKGRSGKGSDVTGGILQKVISCAEPISAGIPVQIISDEINNALIAACNGQEVGTIIEPG